MVSVTCYRFSSVAGENLRVAGDITNLRRILTTLDCVLQLSCAIWPSLSSGQKSKVFVVCFLEHNGQNSCERRWQKEIRRICRWIYELTLFPSLSMSALEHYNIFDLLDSDKFYTCTKVDTSNKSTLVMTSPWTTITCFRGSIILRSCHQERYFMVLPSLWHVWKVVNLLKYRAGTTNQRDLIAPCNWRVRW